jgi:Pumilio-family RNA binding repeat
VLNPSAIAKITIIKGELNLLTARTAIAPISVDIFPVVQLKSDISLAVFGTIAINSYQCFAGEKTILLEQKLENVNFKPAFTRIRITFRWLDTNIEYSIDLLNTFNTYNSQMVTLVLQCMNMHVYIEGIINKSIIKDQNTFILSINKISIEITKAQLMSFTTSSMGSKYEEIRHSCGNLATQPPIIKKINSDLNSIENPIKKPHTPIKQSTPKHSKTPISEKGSHKITKLDNELLNNLTENPVEYYKGKIFELAKTQQGSKYLQNVVQYSTQESICFIAGEVENDFAALLIDKYGNYFCQKFIQSIQPTVRARLLKIVMP